MQHEVNVIVAEDHAILRDGLCSLLSENVQLNVVGEASNGSEAIELAKSLKPQLVIMDLNMPLLSGSEAMTEIQHFDPCIKVIALTVHKSEEYVRMALEAGASGYVLKEDTHTDLLSAIESVMADKIYLSPGICDGVIAGYLGSSARKKTGNTEWDLLTKREKEVSILIAQGKKSREVADDLSVSLKTIEKHRYNLMKKLKLQSATALTRFAMENGIIH